LINGGPSGDRWGHRWGAIDWGIDGAIEIASIETFVRATPVEEIGDRAMENKLKTCFTGFFKNYVNSR